MTGKLLGLDLGSRGGMLFPLRIHEHRTTFLHTLSSKYKLTTPKYKYYKGTCYFEQESA